MGHYGTLVGGSRHGNPSGNLCLHGGSTEILKKEPHRPLRFQLLSRRHSPRSSSHPSTHALLGLSQFRSHPPTPYGTSREGSERPERVRTDRNTSIVQSAVGSVASLWSARNGAQYGGYEQSTCRARSPPSRNQRAATSGDHREKPQNLQWGDRNESN